MHALTMFFCFFSRKSSNFCLMNVISIQIHLPWQFAVIIFCHFLFIKFNLSSLASPSINIISYFLFNSTWFTLHSFIIQNPYFPSLLKLNRKLILLILHHSAPKDTFVTDLICFSSSNQVLHQIYFDAEKNIFPIWISWFKSSYPECFRTGIWSTFFLHIFYISSSSPLELSSV